MTAADASGWFHHRGWWIDASGADVGSVELASSHESNHRQLAASTTFGILTLVLDEVARQCDSPETRRTVADLVATSTATHEAFATWTSVASLGRGPSVLAAHGGYVVHWRAAEATVADIESPYLRLHGVHAVARACMQGDVIAPALRVGLDRFVLADLPQAARPDARFRHLRRAGVHWSGVLDELNARAALDPELDEIISAAQLTADLFASKHADRWGLVNQLMFQSVVEALGTSRPTLGHEEQMTWTKSLTDAGQALAGDGFTLRPTSFAAPTSSTHVVLRNLESEGFSNGPLLRGRWAALDMPLEAMVAATGDDAHVFITLMPDPVASLDIARGDDHLRVLARRTVIDEDGGPTVEVLDLHDRGPSDVERVSVPVLGLVAMSALASLAEGAWLDVFSPANTVVLLDRPLGEHLNLWMRRPDARFRYCLILTQSFGRRLPVLVARLEVGEVGEVEPTYPLIRPLSDAGARTHRAALEEMAMADPRIDADPSLLDDLRSVLPLALAHLAGEQTRFPGIST